VFIVPEEMTLQLSSEPLMSGLRSWTGSEFYNRGPAAVKVLSP